MTMKRVLVCLDVKDGRVVKGVSFEGLRDVGDPVQLARRYEAEGADELVFLDISATVEGRAMIWEIATRTAEQLFVPLTLGGGITSLAEAQRALRAGADKIALNSAAVRDPALITACASAFGAQAVVVSIDAKRVGADYQVFTQGGARATGLSAVPWAQAAVAAGAGELLVTSIDRDGQRSGYDLELTRRIADAVSVPVIASGGAGVPEHLVQAFTTGGAEAALVAGMLHDGTTSVRALKLRLQQAGLCVREMQEVQR
ncbi:MAG: imidazole glycerol phosphate synthase subunit HisF [Planctomycetes bacterium]|nr:imidazole glycerol phosphate synthase subunit HisF [Planctomycetota bacterium]